MNCNSQIHDELKNMMQSTCPFCDRLLVEAHKVVDPCCDKQELETVNGMNICINCGSVHGYDYVPEYFNFYDNMHKIRRKSVYHRKYRIENVLDSIFSDNNIQLTYHKREKIYKVFVEIASVLNKVNDGRKRMISIKYVCWVCTNNSTRFGLLTLFFHVFLHSLVYSIMASDFTTLSLK